MEKYQSLVLKISQNFLHDVMNLDILKTLGTINI